MIGQRPRLIEVPILISGEHLFLIDHPVLNRHQPEQQVFFDARVHRTVLPGPPRSAIAIRDTPVRIIPEASAVATRRASPAPSIIGLLTMGLLLLESSQAITILRPHRIIGRQ